MSKDSKPSEDSCGVEVNTIKALEAKVKASGDDDAMGLVVLLREDIEVNRAGMRDQLYRLRVFDRRLRVFGAMIFILTLITSGLAVAVVAAFKDSPYVKGDSTMSDGNGHIVKVAPAKIGLPLFVAPVMDGERLASIERVRVKTADCANNKTETVERFLKVETVERYNDTALVFRMANNQAVHVWNGETVYVDAHGTAYPVCEAEATCAALYVDDHHEKEQLVEAAGAALEAGGFTEAAARRRLGLGSSSKVKGLGPSYCWCTRMGLGSSSHVALGVGEGTDPRVQGLMAGR
eukprot:CAMPEP_0118811474 /NCGR_PEP_ID=MMETSP1162-20130426/1654_1 /TAXON_ID=33656 /ORGANISM="Phaeocystis Sp, Strain CCMP2710" /LENGTH=291 /DNA_ID=CAMNT_0006741109 /DNA_START=124 /DNA_END=999 /DNA_ORIENTATION=+